MRFPMRIRSGRFVRLLERPARSTDCSFGSMRLCGLLASWRLSGQIVDATIVAAPKQRNTQEEKIAIREGRIPDEWKEKPAKLAQKDRDARWTIKSTKAKLREELAPQVDLAIPAFGYKNHIAVDPAHGLIRKWAATHAAAHDGARLEDLLDRGNTASEVWADTAYRSAKNEAMLARRGFVSRIHRKKPKGKPMPDRTRIANAQKSKVRSAVEHVFAHQKGLLNLTIRTIGLARARVKIGLANLPTTCGASSGCGQNTCLPESASPSNSSSR